MSMKRLCLVFTSMLLFSAAWSQSQPQVTPFSVGMWDVVSTPDDYDVATFRRTLNTINLDNLRFHDSRRVMKFESGIVIELFSVQEVTTQGQTIIWNGLTTQNQTNVSKCMFQLTDSGYLLQKYVEKKLK
jgi:hypothetical protein